MNNAGRKRIGALVVVLLTVLGAWAVLGTWSAEGAAKQVFGYVSHCPVPTPPFLDGVQVSLIDAHGVNDTRTTITTGGLYQFFPPAGTYILALSKANYYNARNATPFRFDGGQNMRLDFCLDPMPTRTITFNVHVQTSGASPISGASVKLFEAGRNQVVASGLTDGAGDVGLLIWSASLELQVSRDPYQPSQTTVNTATGSITVSLANGIVVTGHAIATDGSPITAGVVGYLYNTASVPVGEKVLVANVTAGGLYTFYAIPGTYRMVIDADGHAANVTTIPVAGAPQVLDRTLALSTAEEVKASFVLGRTDWNALSVYRNLSWGEDSSIPGLELPFIRSVVLQIDYTFTAGGGGAGNGAIDPAEWTAFEQWLADRGTFYVTTVNVFDVMGRNFSAASQTAPTAMLAGGRLWVNTSANYTRLGTAIPNGLNSYTVNLTMAQDKNTSAYRDQVYYVNLPRAYEMATFSANTTNGTVTTTGWTNVKVDPSASTNATWSPWIHMNVRKSEGGVARARVTGPAGKFYVVNATLDNYTAIVAARTNVTFSADQSTDPVGDIRNANFTWRFDNVSHPADPAWIGYGIDSTFNYSSGGLFEVNLTVVDAGLNVTNRDFTLYVDDTGPVAQIRTNRTTANANGTTLRLPEDIEVKLDGGFSSDVLYAGATVPGTIFDGVSTPQSGYAWDFDGNGIADSFQKSPKHTYATPGTFFLNLTVTDSVGHKSVNATVTVIVNDTTKPTPNYAILDPSDNWVSPPTRLVEGKAYFFNASTSTDNHDNSSALTYVWTVPGPATVAPFGTAAQQQVVAAKTNATVTASNISVQWTEFNSSYKLKLNVTDTGFGWGSPAKRNWAVANITVVVQFDATKRPNLEVVQSSVLVNPTSPEEGQLVNVTVQVRNQANRGDARSVSARVTQTEPAPSAVISESPQWFDDQWRPLAPPVTIASGRTVYVVFAISFPVQGSKSIEVRVNDTLEPYTQVDNLNRATATVAVRQASWVLPVVAGGSIAVLVAIGAGLRVRSKVRAGELTLRRKKKEVPEGEEKEEEEPEDEKPREKRRL